MIHCMFSFVPIGFQVGWMPSKYKLPLLLQKSPLNFGETKPGSKDSKGASQTTHNLKLPLECNPLSPWDLSHWYSFYLLAIQNHCCTFKKTHEIELVEEGLPIITKNHNHWTRFKTLPGSPGKIPLFGGWPTRWPRELNGTERRGGKTRSSSSYFRPIGRLGD